MNETPNPAAADHDENGIPAAQQQAPGMHWEAPHADPASLRPA